MLPMMEKPLSCREWAMIIINSVVSYCGLYWYPLIANLPHPCLDFDVDVAKANFLSEQSYAMPCVLL